MGVVWWRENWVEVLVVVDGPMVRYHGEAVRHYVLTLMHIVSKGIFFIFSFSSRLMEHINWCTMMMMHCY